MKEIEQKILSLAKNGNIKGRDLSPLVSAYGPHLLTALNQLIIDKVIKESFVPIPGTSYDMNYDVIKETDAKSDL